MTELVDRSIKALRANHAELEALVSAALVGPAERAERSLGVDCRAGALAPGQRSRDHPEHDRDGRSWCDAGTEDNQTIWARWDAASAEEQAAWFLEHDERLLALLEGLTPEHRETLTVDMGFLPEPASLSLALGMRLNEVTAHAWDARVGVDPAAGLDEESAEAAGRALLR